MKEDKKWYYSPNNTKLDLPIKVSSSMVQELTAIYLAIVYARPYAKNLLVLEEPEVHLHPKIQYELGKVLIKYYLDSNSIWMTTHSEYIAHAINNSIKEKYINDLKGHYDMTGIDFKDVNIYNFVRNGNYSKIYKCSKSEDGIELEGFNDFLIKLLDETVQLNDEIEFLEGKDE